MWEPKSPKYNQSKPFISEDWARANLVGLKEADEKTVQDIRVEARKAPEILELEEDQKFRDQMGNILDIEIRGERDIDRIYFKVKDVSEKFDVPHIKRTLNTKEWIEGEDYVLFFIGRSGNNLPRPPNKLFFTYAGMIRYLYTCRSKNAKHFQAWTNRIIFTHQFGSKKEKRTLAAGMLGADASAVKEVFRADARSLPCIYLFYVGTVSSLKDSIEVPPEARETDMIFKYGFTTDLARRTAEHQRRFTELKLKFFSYIDPQFCSKAETVIKNIFAAFGFNIKSAMSDELALIPKNKLDIIEKQYNQIGSVYLGHLAEINSRMREAEMKICAAETRVREVELGAQTSAQIAALQYEKEIQKLQHENEILRLRLTVVDRLN